MASSANQSFALMVDTDVLKWCFTANVYLTIFLPLPQQNLRRSSGSQTDSVIEKNRGIASRQHCTIGIHLQAALSAWKPLRCFTRSRLLLKQVVRLLARSYRRSRSASNPLPRSRETNGRCRTSRLPRSAQGVSGRGNAAKVRRRDAISPASCRLPCAPRNNAFAKLAPHERSLATRARFSYGAGNSNGAVSQAATAGICRRFTGPSSRAG